MADFSDGSTAPLSEQSLHRFLLFLLRLCRCF